MSTTWYMTASLYFIVAVAGLALVRRQGRRVVVGWLGVCLTIALSHAARTRQSFLLTEWVAIAAGVALSCAAVGFKRRTIVTCGVVALSLLALRMVGEIRETWRREATVPRRCPLIGTMTWSVSDATPRPPVAAEQSGRGGVMVWTYPDKGWLAAVRDKGVGTDRSTSNWPSDAASEEPVAADVDVSRLLLRDAHTNVAENFVRTAGFGFRRMSPQLVWPSLFLPEACPTSGSNGGSVDRPQGNLHSASVAARSEEPVAIEGTTLAKGSNDATKRRWTAESVQLVSLLQHWTPVAYYLDRLPTMDETDSVPTRTLDDFERAGLARLERGDDVVVEIGTDQVRMIGSLRSTTRDCGHCHRVAEGTLLGAITYRLKPHDAALHSDNRGE